MRYFSRRKGIFGTSRLTSFGGDHPWLIPACYTGVEEPPASPASQNAHEQPVLKTIEICLQTRGQCRWISTLYESFSLVCLLFPFLIHLESSGPEPFSHSHTNSFLTLDFFFFFFSCLVPVPGPLNLHFPVLTLDLTLNPGAPTNRFHCGQFLLALPQSGLLQVQSSTQIFLFKSTESLYFGPNDYHLSVQLPGHLQ